MRRSVVAVFCSALKRITIDSTTDFLSRPTRTNSNWPQSDVQNNA
jgi:hypothetical protein